MLTPINNSNYQTKSQIIWIVIIAVIVLALASFTLYISFADNSGKQISNSPVDIIKDIPISDPIRQTAEKKDRPSFGNENAKLIIVEFSDFQCPVCQAEFPIIREIINKYKDKILFIYRQYPIINDNSITVSMASLCADEQNKFWTMHDRLFLNPSDEFSSDDLKTIARQSGLNIDQFNACLSQEKYKGMVTEDLQDGFTLEAPGTPTFFINGNRLSGQISKEAWEVIINESLKLLDK